MECKLAPIKFSNVIIMLGIAWVPLLVVLKAHHADAVTPQMTVEEMIESYGYPAEKHRGIRTEDGYMLTVFRIPHGIGSSKRTKRPVVFLMHGLLSSAFDWVNMGPGFSISYDLAEAGYDVWLGNARGNKLTRIHMRLNPTKDKRQFWSYSWHEIGYYDIPAMIDFVLDKTQVKKLFYIGHSQGATTFFVMASTRPEYNNKIKLMVALGPLVHMKNQWNPFLRVLSKGHKSLKLLTKIIGEHEFIPGQKLFNLIGKRICYTMAVVKAMCTNGLFMIAGWDSQQFNKSTLPIIAANVPTGGATREFLHYAQAITSGEFRQYNLGRFQNKKKYKAWKPPMYDLRKVRAPVALVYADNDWLAAAADVQKLRTELGFIADMYRVPFPKFNHLDFLYGVDVKKLVNDWVMETLLSWK